MYNLRCTMYNLQDRLPAVAGKGKAGATVNAPRVKARAVGLAKLCLPSAAQPPDFQIQNPKSKIQNQTSTIVHCTL